MQVAQGSLSHRIIALRPPAFWAMGRGRCACKALTPVGFVVIRAVGTPVRATAVLFFRVRAAFRGRTGLDGHFNEVIMDIRNIKARPAHARPCGYE